MQPEPDFLAIPPIAILRPSVQIPDNLPEGVQEQVDLFLADYPKSGPELVRRYLNLVMSEEYRSSSMGRSETHKLEATRPHQRNRVKEINEPKKTKKGTSKSSRIRAVN